ncbi:MAG: spermidine synthase [Myxococcales bacterium]|nr:spermidine synthase [Myxococcales bacterium]
MRFALALVVAAASGFIALSYEILWYRVISFASLGLSGAFGLLLAFYLFGLALGARLAGAFCKDDAAAGDRTNLRRLAAFTFVANVFAWLVVPAFGWSARIWDWPLALGAVTLAAAMLGAILPLVCHFAIKPDDRAGANISYVYLANIVGSAAGSLVTGFVFLDLFPLQQVGAVITALGMMLVVLLLALSGGRDATRSVALGATVASGLLVVMMTPRLYDRIWERLLFKAKFDESSSRFAEVIETKSGVITVTADNVVYGGGAYDGKINTSLVYDNNGIQRVYGIGAMHPAPKKVLMIGLASGSWAKVVSAMPGVEKLTVVEINPGYLTLIGRHKEVASLLADPKVEITIDDGRRWLLRHAQRFDVIVMNTTYHWRAHATSLLSMDFMEIARAHLEQGGFLFFNTTGSDDVMKTAMTAFPFGLRVYNFAAVSDSPIVYDSERFRRMLDAFRLDGEPVVDTSTEQGAQVMDDLMAYAETISQPPQEEGLESRENILQRTRSALVITDDNMIPEWRTIFRFHDAP